MIKGSVRRDGRAGELEEDSVYQKQDVHEKSLTQTRTTVQQFRPNYCRVAVPHFDGINTFSAVFSLVK